MLESTVEPAAVLVPLALAVLLRKKKYQTATAKRTSPSNA
jgi:hypothetical protein